MRALKFVGYIFVLLIVIVIAALFFIDIIAKFAIEEEGTKAVKAKVEVDSVDVRFFPLGASIYGLKVTNPQAPMTNAFEAELIDANLDWEPLLKSKVIVETAALEGMRFNTARSVTGAVPGLTPPPSQEPSLVDQFKEDMKLPAIDIPDPSELLARVDLKTVSMAKEMEASLSARKKAWKERIDALPNKETLESYKQRIKALKEAKNPLERLQAVAKVKDLQSDAKKDLQKIRDAKSDLEKEVAQLKADLAKVKAAPQEDMKRVMELAGLNPGAWEGLAKALFGDEVAKWANNAYMWYGRLQPYINGSGEEAQKSAPEPDTTDYSDGLPRFLVKTLSISGKLPIPQQDVPFSGKFNNLTDRADVWGKPAQLALQSQAQGVGKLDFKGVLDHVTAVAKDSFSFDLTDLPVTDIVFSDKEDFPVTLSKAIAAIAGKADITDGKLAMNVDAKFLEVQLANLLEGESAPLKKALLNALKNISQFDVNMLASGALQDPEVKITSSLDKILSQSVKGLIDEEKKKLSGKVQAKLNEIVSEKVGGLDSELNGLVDINALLQERIGDFSNLL
ncbi:Chromosome segregation ATPase [Hahella chejuensis KCTC 2396]|uniref:Chromosome segregation ATPase n=1 Tax=Hahella chejuensis (strain KCTC 2396) TaxID=349521 RepID=Q2SNX7_HAHCH|nr:TIGR03545 family protein [Hahella chejuensis]ABC27647.1 Chromosome segregation ATPase [Hahella chejuensis KCTC 2396]